MNNDYKKKSILLVEDDAIIAIMEKRQLEKEGYRVIHTLSGEEAIDLLNVKMEPVDLILMDIDLGPGMDGTETAVKILKKHDIPVLFLSSHTEKEIVNKTENITSYGYVVKNSGITVLDASIKMAFKLFNANLDLLNKEKQLIENEEKFRTLYEQSSLAISYYTPEGRVISFNERTLEKMNKRIEDVEGKFMYEVLPTEYAYTWMERIKLAASTPGIAEYEDCIELPDAKVWYANTYSKTFDDNNNLIGIQIISKNITDRKMAEEALREKDEFLISIIENIPDMIFIKDAKDLKFLQMNRAGEKILGYNRNELIGKNDYDFFPKEQADFFTQKDRAVLESGKLCDIPEEPIETKTGKHMLHTKKIPLYDKKGRPAYLLGISDDITERKKIEAELYRSKASLEKAQSLAHIGNWELDPDTGTGHWSKEMFNLFNRDISEGVPALDDFLKMVHPDDREKLLEVQRLVIDTGKPEQAVYRTNQEFGEERYFETTIDAVRDPDGKLLSLSGTVLDITRNKRTEEILTRTNRELEQQKKVLAILNEIISIANSASDLDSLFAGILEGSLRLLDYDAGGIYIIGSSGNNAELAYHSNLPSDFVEKAGKVSTTDYKYFNLFNLGIPVITDHYERISPEHAKKTGFCSLISVPLYSKNRIIGALNLISKKRYVVSAEEKDAMLAIGRELGTLIERIAAEDEAKRTAKNIKTIFDSVDEMVYIVDISGKIIQVNDAVTRLLLYEHDELTGSDIVQLNVPERREEARGIFQQIVTGKSDSCPIPLIAKNGTVIEVETKITRGLWNDRKVIIGVSRDINERVQAEKALNEAEKRFKIFFDCASDGFLGAWPDTHKLATANSKMCGMLGYTEYELLNMHVSDIHPHDSLPYVNDQFKKLLNKEISIAHDIPLVKKDGGVFFTDVTASPIRFQGKEYLLGLFRDITDRKQIEEALRESEFTFKTMVELSPIAIYMTEGKGLKVLYINPKFIELFGYSVEEIQTAEDWWLRAYPDQEYRKHVSEEWLSRIFRAIESGEKVLPMDTEVTCKDGSKKNILWGFISTEHTNITYGQDFTEVRQTKERIQLIKDRLDYALHSVNTGAWELDLKTSTAWRSIEHDQIFGYKTLMPEWTFDIFIEHVLPEDRELVKEKFNTSLADKTEWNFECRIVRRDGLTRWIWAKGNPGFDKDDNPVTMFGIVRDITESKLAEEKIIKLLHEKEILLKEIHHRIKNNMNIISGLLTLQAEIHESTETKHILLDAAGRVQSMMVLYDKLYHSEISGNLSIGEYLPSLINEIINIFPRCKTIKIITKIDDISISSQKLATLGIIINELITNSMKYAFTGRADGTISVTSHKNSGPVTLIYEDNGTGIVDTEAFVSSSGFGIELVKTLVAQLDGSIKIESDNGLRFILEFEP